MIISRGLSLTAHTYTYTYTLAVATALLTLTLATAVHSAVYLLESHWQSLPRSARLTCSPAPAPKVYRSVSSWSASLQCGKGVQTVGLVCYGAALPHMGQFLCQEKAMFCRGHVWPSRFAINGVPSRHCLPGLQINWLAVCSLLGHFSNSCHVLANVSSSSGGGSSIKI